LYGKIEAVQTLESMIRLLQRHNDYSESGLEFPMALMMMTQYIKLVSSRPYMQSARVTVALVKGALLLRETGLDLNDPQDFPERPSNSVIGLMIAFVPGMAFNKASPKAYLSYVLHFTGALLVAGLDPDVCERHGNTPLLTASIELANLLSGRGDLLPYNLLPKRDNDSKQLCIDFIESFIIILIKAGCDIHVFGRDDWSPTWVFIGSGFEDTWLRILLRAGLNPVAVFRKELDIRKYGKTTAIEKNVHNSFQQKPKRRSAFRYQDQEG
jgi:hypothetical protein